MNKQQYAALIEAELEKIKTIIKAKNNDYTAGSGSAFANFESTPALCSPFSGVLIRMGDKFKRLETYASKGKLEVANEGADDAARDIIGYALILLGMLSDSKKSVVGRMTHVDDAVTALAGQIDSDGNASGEVKIIKSRFQLEDGKSYLTRNGSLIRNLQIKEKYGINKELWRGVNSSWQNSDSYNKDGTLFNAPENATPFDLVAEYTATQVKAVDAETEYV